MANIADKVNVRSNGSNGNNEGDRNSAVRKTVKAKTVQNTTETATKASTKASIKAPATLSTKEIVTTGENVQAIVTESILNITPETTLNELISLARNNAIEKPETTPKFSTLRKNANCVASYRSDDHRSSLFVYDNGFAAYETDGRTTAIDLDEISSVKYVTSYDDLSMERSDFDREWLGNLPWAFALALLGEEQINIQMAKDKAHDYISDDDIDHNSYDGYYENKKLNIPALAVHISDPETAFIRKETNREIRQALEKTRSEMTEKQAEAFVLYHDRDMSEEEIGRILKVSHQAVSQRLEVVKRNLRKNMERFL